MFFCFYMYFCRKSLELMNYSAIFALEILKWLL